MIGSFFLLTFTWKAAMMISFGVCPIFKYKVTTKLIGAEHVAQTPDNVKLSNKSLRFREEIKKWREHRQMQNLSEENIVGAKTDPNTSVN